MLSFVQILASIWAFAVKPEKWGDVSISSKWTRGSRGLRKKPSGRVSPGFDTQHHTGRWGEGEA